MHLKYTGLIDALAELGEPGVLLHTDRWAAIARGLTCGFFKRPPTSVAGVRNSRSIDGVAFR